VLYAGHGGGGYIISIGALKQMGWEGGRDCILKQTNGSGGDALVTRCFQMFHDLAHTDPGPGLLNRGREWLMFDNGDRYCIENAAQQVLAERGVSKQCRWVLRNGVSFHVGFRGPDMGPEKAPEAMKNITRSQAAARAYLAVMQK
jgi:hypothetical protein